MAVTEKEELIPNRLLDVADLRRILGVSDATVRIYMRTGRLPTPIRIGRLYKWRPDQIRAYIGEPVEG